MLKGKVLESLGKMEKKSFFYDDDDIIEVRLNPETGEGEILE